MKLLIWWLNQPCTEIVVEHLAVLPKYLQSEVKSREGRPGRGRLWIHKSLPEVKVDPWPGTFLGTELENGYGGIVFKAKDLPAVRKLPGIVTDLALNLVTS